MRKRRFGRVGEAGALPEAGFRVDLGEERASDLGEERVEVGEVGRRQGAGSGGDLGEGEAGGGSFGYGPDERGGLAGGGVLQRARGEALGHPGGEREVDGEWITRAGSEESAGDGIEDGGVDQAVARAEGVMRGGEIAMAGEGGVSESAESFRGEGLGLGTKQEAGRGLVLLKELEGVEVIGGGEYPAAGSGGGGGVRSEAEVRIDRGGLEDRGRGWLRGRVD